METQQVIREIGTSVISIDNACFSAANHACLAGTDAFYITIRNVGTTSLSSGTIQIYVTDTTTPADGGSTTCSIASFSGTFPLVQPGPTQQHQAQVILLE